MQLLYTVVLSRPRAPSLGEATKYQAVQNTCPGNVLGQQPLGEGQRALHLSFQQEDIWEDGSRCARAILQGCSDLRPRRHSRSTSPLPTFVLKRRIRDLDAPLSAPRDPQHIQGGILSLDARQVSDASACG